MSNFELRIREYPYQQHAVDAILGVFNALHKQPKKRLSRVVLLSDGSSEKIEDILKTEQGVPIIEDEVFANGEIELSDSQLLKNINEVQGNRITHSEELADQFEKLVDKNNEKSCGCRCSIDIDMETGTGKTFVYTKSIFELNKHYGWRKFIVVVPNVAIREGVKISFEQTGTYFSKKYEGKYIDSFIYDSNTYETPLKNFSMSDEDGGEEGNAINVMIINSQAFNAQMKRRIYLNQEGFFSDQRPIDVIAATRPIVILDEPHRMGNATQRGIRDFNPLFVMNFSATHRNHHDLIYVLDAHDAFINKLVKKIRVKGFDFNDLPGGNGFVHLSQIFTYHDKDPEARITIEVRHANGTTKREGRRVKREDDLYELSKGRFSEGLDQYKDKGYVVENINKKNNTITFQNGETLTLSEVVGAPEEEALPALQIEETIRSHFEKEKKLFELRERGMRIKCLSLFFINRVINYREYNSDGSWSLGVYAKMFEDIYNRVKEEYQELLPEDDPYRAYLEGIEAGKTHSGYFAKDKKTHMFKDSEEKDEETISAYDLILKNKERLLSFDEPTRFIFSHSALREGWDNPNVFQICTLKNSDSYIEKRQEMGRGMRLCVTDSGERMDMTVLGKEVHDVNTLTVIASESYEAFAGGLQKYIEKDLYERPPKAKADYFKGKIVTINGEEHEVDDVEAAAIESYLYENDYIDDEGNITEEYNRDKRAGTFKPLLKRIARFDEASVHRLIQSIYSGKDILSRADEQEIDNSVNKENFKKFEKLWNRINQKYTYNVYFESDDEFFKSMISEINEKLNVEEPTYSVSIGEQEDASKFSEAKTSTPKKAKLAKSSEKYDLVGKIAGECSLTRSTVCKILKGIDKEKFDMFKVNPEEFIRQVARTANLKLAKIAVKNIEYEPTGGKYSNRIFNVSGESSHAIEVGGKHITPYIISDSDIELDFAKALNNAEEVCVFAKLPTSFTIPTPMGNYSPDWAVVFSEEKVMHIYFVVETKGSTKEGGLRGVERDKTDCAERLFKKFFPNGEVIYKVATKYKEDIRKLLGIR